MKTLQSVYEQTKGFIGNLDFKGDDKVILIAFLLVAIFFFVFGSCFNPHANNDTNNDDTNTEKLLDQLLCSGKISKQQYIYYIDKYTDGHKVKRTKLL